ncbi:MAG TPA: hypothetical protein DCZ23_08845 [Lachnospiraceae bacterium]|nr:hypothetical protein [Lachnospiraceae bacterium]
MRTELIPKVITLLAGAVVCIVCIVRDIDTLYSLKALLATLIIFYIIGCIAKRIIGRVKDINTFMKRAEPDTKEGLEDITGEDISISSDGFENNNV